MAPIIGGPEGEIDFSGAVKAYQAGVENQFTLIEVSGEVPPKLTGAHLKKGAEAGITYLKSSGSGPVNDLKTGDQYDVNPDKIILDDAGIPKINHRN